MLNSREEIKDNPLVALTLWFRDGAALRQVFSNPVPQAKAMPALGHIVAELGGELNIDLEGHMIPAELIELVNQEIHRGIEKWGHVDKTPQDFMIAIIEELGEAAHAINHGKSVETVRQELAEVIALLVRLWDKIPDV